MSGKEKKQIKPFKSSLKYMARTLGVIPGTPFLVYFPGENEDLVENGMNSNFMRCTIHASHVWEFIGIINDRAIMKDYRGCLRTKSSEESAWCIGFSNGLTIAEEAAKYIDGTVFRSIWGKLKKTAILREGEPIAANYLCESLEHYNFGPLLSKRDPTLSISGGRLMYFPLEVFNQGIILLDDKKESSNAADPKTFVLDVSQYQKVILMSGKNTILEFNNNSSIQEWRKYEPTITSEAEKA